MSPNASVTQEHRKGISQAELSTVEVLDLVQLPVTHPSGLPLPSTSALPLCCKIVSNFLNSFLSHTTAAPYFLPFLKYVFTEVPSAWR